MGSFSGKRSVMTLYSDSKLGSHGARLAFAEKGIAVNVIEVDERDEQTLDELLALNPYQTIPTLIDRDLILYKSSIIMEYLDERFPHPPLLPVYPIARAKFRLTMFRVESDLYPLVQIILTGNALLVEQARKELRESLIRIAPIFKDYPYCLSEELSLIDCSLIPILWRLPSLGVELPREAHPMLEYAERIFQRDAFKKSLTEIEAEMRTSRHS